MAAPTITASDAANMQEVVDALSTRHASIVYKVDGSNDVQSLLLPNGFVVTIVTPAWAEADLLTDRPDSIRVSNVG